MRRRRGSTQPRRGRHGQFGRGDDGRRGHRGVRPRRRRLRPQGGRQSRLPRAPGDLRAPAGEGTGRRRCRTAGRRPGLRHRRLHSGARADAAESRNSRGRRFGGHARGSAAQVLAGRRPLRARPSRGRDRRQGGRPRRRRFRRLPAAQLPRRRRGAGGGERPGAARRADRAARVLRGGLGGGARGVDARVLGRGDPAGAGLDGPHPPVPLPVAQRAGVRQRGRAARADERGGAGRRRRCTAAGLAARHHAHVHRPPPGLGGRSRSGRRLTASGRDRRAVAIAPAAPDGVLPDPAPRVAVVGGGIAGLAAAMALAERGVAATVLEREESLGGRLRGWPIRLRDGSAATMTRGFHAFFRQYYNLRALLARADPGLEALTPLTDYPLVHARGARDGFAGLPSTPPWNALALAVRSRSFPARELARVNVTAALQLLDADVPGVYARLDHVSAPELLEAVGFPESARHLAFEVFSRSFFADPHRLSAAELAVMFHIYFLGSSEGLIFDVPRSPFPQALWEPLAARLRALGTVVRTSARVEGIAEGRRRRFALVCTGGPAEEYDAVVLAADVAGLRELVGDGRGPAAWSAGLGALPSAPPFLVSRLWLDRPVDASRPGFLGTAGFPTLDNVSVLERYE